MRPPHRLDDLRQRVDGRAPGVLAAPAMVRDDDPVDAGVGGEHRILVRQDALEHDLHLCRVAQPLEEIPGHGGRLVCGEARRCRRPGTSRGA